MYLCDLFSQQSQCLLIISLNLYICSQYMSDGLKGGHVIMLGPNCEAATLDACQAYPQGLHVGGKGKYIATREEFWFS